MPTGQFRLCWCKGHFVLKQTHCIVDVPCKVVSLSSDHDQVLSQARTGSSQLLALAGFRIHFFQGHFSSQGIVATMLSTCSSRFARLTDTRSDSQRQSA